MLRHVLKISHCKPRMRVGSELSVTTGILSPDFLSFLGRRSDCSVLGIAISTDASYEEVQCHGTLYVLHEQNVILSAVH